MKNDLQLKSQALNRGSYKCGRCGMPKKGHVCSMVHGKHRIVEKMEPSSPSANLPSFPAVTPHRGEGVDYTQLPFASPNILAYAHDLADLPDEVLLKSPLVKGGKIIYQNLTPQVMKTARAPPDASRLLHSTPLNPSSLLAQFASPTAPPPPPLAQSAALLPPTSVIAPTTAPRNVTTTLSPQDTALLAPTTHQVARTTTTTTTTTMNTTLALQQQGAPSIRGKTLMSGQHGILDDPFSPPQSIPAPLASTLPTSLSSPLAATMMTKSSIASPPSFVTEMQPTPTSTTTMQDLTPACLQAIFQHLAPRDLCHVASVSKAWHQATRAVWDATRTASVVIRAGPDGLHDAHMVLCRAPHVTHLTLLLDAPLEDASVLSLLQVSLPAHITHLTIECRGPLGANRLSPPALQALVDALPRLETLHLDGLSMSTLTLRHACLSRLRIATHSAMSASSSFTTTRRGNVTLLTNQTSDDVSTDLHRLHFECPRLESLTLNLSSSSAWPVTSAATMRFLSNVSLAPSPAAMRVATLLTDVAESSAVSLRHVCVSSPHLTDRAVTALLSCPTASRWESLCIRRAAGLTAEGVRSVALKCPSLTLLDLSACASLADEALTALERAACRITLRHVHLACCPLLSRAAVARLVAALPTLQTLDLGCSLVEKAKSTMMTTTNHHTAGLFAPSPLRAPGASLADADHLMSNILGSPSMQPRARILIQGRQGIISNGMDRSPPPSFEALHPSSRLHGSCRRSLLEDLDPSAVGPSQLFVLKSDSLRHLSLWGCTRIKALTLQCPSLIELNLADCRNLEPALIQVASPLLSTLYARGCVDGVAVRVWDSADASFLEATGVSPWETRMHQALTSILAPPSTMTTATPSSMRRGGGGGGVSAAMTTTIKAEASLGSGGVVSGGRGGVVRSSGRTMHVTLGPRAAVHRVVETNALDMLHDDDVLRGLGGEDDALFAMNTRSLLPTVINQEAPQSVLLVPEALRSQWTGAPPPPHGDSPPAGRDEAAAEHHSLVKGQRRGAAKRKATEAAAAAAPAPPVPAPVQEERRSRRRLNVTRE